MIPRTLSDSEALDAKALCDSGRSVRAVAVRLGVSHQALSKRLRTLRESAPESEGYLPDELDKAIVRAVLGAGIPGGLERLSDITGWSCIELLEVVKDG